MEQKSNFTKDVLLDARMVLIAMHGGVESIDEVEEKVRKFLEPQFEYDEKIISMKTIIAIL